MSKLFKRATEQKALLSAWRKIRQNGRNSTSEDTVRAIERFEGDAFGNIRRLQRELRTKNFKFDKQVGVLKSKTDGSKRGLVLASVRNRIVERALLDCMQHNVPFVRKVIEHPNSVGGVPHRSVPHGLAQIRRATTAGAKWFVRSDISSFFDNVPRDRVLETLSRHIDDQDFMEILSQATKVSLENELALGEDRAIFPTDTEGVAQGSPLSALFGNILLYDFDQNMNCRGIVCVRFIDDFVLLGEHAKSVRKAFESGKRLLSELSLECHDPFLPNANKSKTERGQVNDGFTFLGYDIKPGLHQPSAKARSRCLKLVEDAIKDGRTSIALVHECKNSFERQQRYSQTLVRIDRILRGWGNSFAYGEAPGTLKDLDEKLSDRLERFRTWFARKVRKMSREERRRLIGVCLLQDVPPKDLNELPFVIDCKKPFRKRNDHWMFSTDGSVIPRRGKRDAGPGGWAVVNHATKEVASGASDLTTNNAMELTAVVKALRQSPPTASVEIYTDSEYVERTFNKRRRVTANLELWRELIRLAQTRSLRLQWVQGHSGDEFNELADGVARSEAKDAAERLSRS